MSRDFIPRLEILPPAQRQLWRDLVEVPRQFVLYGGTAVALHLGHRTSVDFDLFGSQAFDPDSLYAALELLRGAEIIQKSGDTLTCIIRRDGDVRMSFFGPPSLRRVQEPSISPDNGLQVAALLDLAGSKAAVVQKRAEAKDYIDLDVILSHGGLNLPAALAAARHIYRRSFNPQITLKALSYFGDGNLPSLSAAVRQRLTDAVRGVDLDFQAWTR